MARSDYESDSKIIAVRAGDFYFNAAIQVGGTGTGEVYVWMRLNGKDMDDSNSIQSIPLKGFTAVLVVQTGLSLKKGDVVEIAIAGGGGMFPPEQRSVELLNADIDQLAVTIEGAKRDYAVSLETNKTDDKECETVVRHA